jgi:hypothetical protein
MKRIAGLAALLGLVAAACSDSPTAPTDTGAKLRVATPPMGAEAKAAWYKSMGFEQHQTGSSTSGLQYLITPPPFWNTPFGANLNEGDDDCKFVSFGFVFTFYGRQYTGAWVGSNGYIVFQPAGSSCPFDQYYYTFLNNSYPGNGNYPLIAGLWSDWYPPAYGSVNFKIVGLPPLRRLVVTWAGVPEYPGFGSNTFQVQLLEFLSTIVMSYNGLSANGIHGSDAMSAGIASGVFTGYGAGYGGLPSARVVATGTQVPALDGHTVCLVNLGSGYQQYDNICSLFVH